VSANLQNPIFHDETKAREWLEARVWPNGPVCPHCGNAGQARIRALAGKSHRPGLYQCAECREQFTVTVKTVFERSKIPLTKWLAALFVMVSSEKSVSARQIHRMLGITYKSAWFMMHRLREAMRSGGLGPSGGESAVVEADGTLSGRIEGAPPREHCGERLLHRFPAEFGFRHSNHVALGADEADELALNIVGERLIRLWPDGERRRKKMAEASSLKKPPIWPGYSFAASSLSYAAVAISRLY
jgi:transposase-like protein